MFDRIWFRSDIPDFALDAKFAIENLIESLRLKSYEEGAKEFQKMGVWYDKGMADGRAAVIAELLAEMPQERDSGTPREDQDDISVAFNGALHAVKEIIESKRTTK